MTKRTPRNIAASVQQKLMTKAKNTNRPFNEILQYYAIERFIYRLSRSVHSNYFILKGALMFLVWKTPITRPTKDIDFLGKVDNSIEKIKEVIEDVCIEKVEPDGIIFNTTSINAIRITEDADYEGVRVRFKGNLGNAHLTIQIDIGFGDVIVPGAKKITYPAMLDFPSPELSGYSMESTIAEKLHPPGPWL